MSERFSQYTAERPPVPSGSWTWNMYGAGLENVGREGRPESFPVPEPGPGQLLVRVDAVGMCFSDVKLIKQGGGHPKLYGRDLSKEPTRLGHEVALTVVDVADSLRGRFHPGQRLALQPDIRQGGRSTAYGYTIPGGLTQFHLIGSEVLDAEGECFVLPVEGALGYAAVALTEPWACVEAAYTQRRRLIPRPGGSTWIIGRPGDDSAYSFEGAIAEGASIVATGLGGKALDSLGREAARVGARIQLRNEVPTEGFAALAAELTGGWGFDDVVLLDPRSAAVAGEAARLVAQRGTFNLVGRVPLDGPVQIDVGRIHYDYVAYVGTSLPEVAAAYGETRNRCELRDGGTAVFVGAGGPMGQMHIQRALEMSGGPGTLIAAEVNPARLASLEAGFAGLAREHGKELVPWRPTPEGQTLHQLVAGLTGGRGADDVVVTAPSAEAMADAARLMSQDGMLVLFAGVPNGTYAPLDLSQVYMGGAQFTGTSGSALADQERVIRKALEGTLSPGRSVGAIGGFEAAVEGARAMIEGRFPGKILIFPQLSGLPLQGLPELSRNHPDIGRLLGPDCTWTVEAERALIEKFWRPGD